MIKKYFSILFFQLLCLFVYSQISIKGEIDKSSYPEIKFILHDKNPEKSDKDLYDFYEVDKGKRHF